MIDTDENEKMCHSQEKILSKHTPDKGSTHICFPIEASLVVQMVKNLPAMQDTWVRSLGREDALEKQVSRGSPGEYQADERAGVARLSWRVSGR